jgi:type VI secretion system protein ImpG
MRTANMTLKDFFRNELAALRTESLGFSEKHPELARVLGLNERQATDPQVELLLQSFAFLSGRLRYQIEQDKTQLPNALLAFLYPHMEAPIPSMLIAEISPKPDGANFAAEQLLARGRYVLASAENNLGKKIDCRFRTCYETPLLALIIDDIKLESVAEYPCLGRTPAAKSVLKVRLRTDGIGKLQVKGKGPARLRFYINDAEASAFPLYELLALHLSAITIAPAQPEQTATLLPANKLRWLGMDDSEAILQVNPHTHSGFRLLQEYFSFPEKFLFFEITQLDEINLTGIENTFDLLFVLDAPYDAMQVFSKKTLLLNCVPLVNLFSQRIDPLDLNHTEYEYHLMGDLKNHRYCEIVAIEELESISSKGGPRPIAPYFAMDNFRRLEQQDYFYITRRQQALDVEGTELFVSFLDQQFSLGNLVDEVVVGRALCTNRRLPERLMSGNTLQLEGAGPVTGVRALSKPTPYHNTENIGQRPWALVSGLSLNHLSLSDGPVALRALKDILRLHLGSNPGRGQTQIDAIENLRSRNIMRQVGQDGWRGFVRGSELTLTMDGAAFRTGSPVLFCSVLRHFLRSYASVNHLIELQLETNDIKGPQKQWQPLTGTTIAL